MPRVLVALGISLLLVSFGAGASPSHEGTEKPAGRNESAGDSEERELMTLCGTVSVKGNEPFTFPALSVDDGTGALTVYELVGPLSDEIRVNHQRKTLEVSGRIVREAAGPGFPARFEVVSYTLK